MRSRLEKIIERAVKANRDIPPVRILVEMEQAVEAMHSKDFGPNGHSALMADLILCVVDPKFRDVWAGK